MKMRHPGGNLPGQQVSAPHPRGCSAAGAPGLHPREVGPAPAGMLRGTLCAAWFIMGRPRTRGDAPQTGAAAWSLGESAPHPRGCSVRAADHFGGCGVGPAPAGMLLRIRIPRASRFGRPRTRGDAPWQHDGWEAQTGSAPHPRGCSLLQHCGCDHGHVGPAPAGMLRGQKRSSASPRRRPRTRGDAPVGRSGEARPLPSAPHPRGCSVPLARGAHQHHVGPAPAGMLPSR